MYARVASDLNLCAVFVVAYLTVQQEKLNLTPVCCSCSFDAPRFQATCEGRSGPLSGYIGSGARDCSRAQQVSARTKAEKRRKSGGSECPQGGMQPRMLRNAL
jgi:hypothetical protein